MIIGKSHDAGDDPSRDVFGARIKRTHENARTIGGGQGRSGAFGMESGGFQSVKVSPESAGRRAMIPALTRITQTGPNSSRSKSLQNANHAATRTKIQIR